MTSNRDNRKMLFILIFVSVWALVIVGLGSGLFEEDIRKKIELPVTIFVATTSIFFTLLEIQRNSEVQRANFVKDYIAALHINDDLKRTFHDLVYLYKDENFEKIHKTKEIDLKDAGEVLNTFFLTGEGEINHNRIEGTRFYHLTNFQGSEEERKLDSLLYYFDVIGYYYEKGLITLTDVNGTIGYFIDCLSSRKCTKTYLELIFTSGKNKPEAIIQFRYLMKLILDFKTLGQQTADKRNIVFKSKEHQDNKLISKTS